MPRLIQTCGTAHTAPDLSLDFGRAREWPSTCLRTSMFRTIGLLVCSFAALAQGPLQDPMRDAVDAYRKAHRDGRFDEAAAKRQEARKLLDRIPVDAPSFPSWVSSVASLYSGAARIAEARDVLQAALARTSALGESHPNRIQILEQIPNLWQQNGELLQYTAALERLVAAKEAAALRPKTALPVPERVIFSSVSGAFSSARISYMGGTIPYMRLIDAYLQSGRPEAVAGVEAKLKSDPKYLGELASFYQRSGRSDEAAAIYKRQADDVAAGSDRPIWEKIAPLQSLANLYQQDGAFADAVGAMRQAIAKVDAAGLPNRSQSRMMRRDLAKMLDQGGMTTEAEQVYQQLLAETVEEDRLWILDGYANHLATSGHREQAESMLKEYLAKSTNASEQAQLLQRLGSLANQAGDQQRGDEYRRRASEKQQIFSNTPRKSELMGLIDQAREAANRRHPDEAFELCLRALEAAGQSPDRDQITWAVPSLIDELRFLNGTDKGNQLYQRLLELVRSWSADSLQSLLGAQDAYLRYLMAQPEHRHEMHEAMTQYQETLTQSGGAVHASATVLRLTVQAELQSQAPARAIQAAEELLAVEASRAGTTSEPYLRAIQELARTCHSAGDLGRAIDWSTQTLTIADKSFPMNYSLRGETRIQTARLLAAARRFDYAERLATEAVELGASVRPKRTNLFVNDLEQIRTMRRNSR